MATPKRERRQVQPTEADARDQLDRILASPAFAANAQRKALLRYLVEEALAGRGDKLKGFAIAVAVFGRDETFDPQSDPVVRLEARRLRRDLDIYYGTAGAHDPVRITIPKGAYIPSFTWQEGTPALSPSSPVITAEPEAASGGAASFEPTGRPTAAASSGAPSGPAAEAVEPATSRRGVRRRLVPTLVGAAIILVAIGGWLAYQFLGKGAAVATFAPQEHGATVIVLPFQALSPSADDEFLAVGLAQQLIAELMQFSGLKLYSVPSSLRQSPTANPATVAQDLPVAYVVNGSVRSDAGRIRVSVELFDAKSSQVLWSETYDRPLSPDNLLDVQEDLATRIATRLGQPYGVVRRAITEQLGDNRPRTMAAYACVLQAYTYRRTFARVLYAPARACLEDAVRLDPGYADAWALLGWMRLDAARFGNGTPTEAASEMNGAFADARRSVDLAPQNVLSLQSLAAIMFYRGEFDEAERIQRKALALNPNDPETLAQLGWRLAVRGRWDEGLGYLTQAIGRSSDPPPWYFISFAIHDYVFGNYDQALAAATKARKDEFGAGWSLYAIIQAALGNKDEAAKALAEMAAVSPSLARDPGAWYRIHQADEAIVDRLVEGLRAAGWHEPGAMRPAVGAQ